MTKATKTIPIVGVDLESDPAAKGWVASLARPGGNVTGFFLEIPEMSGKQLQLLKEVKPTLARVAVLGDGAVNELQFRAAEGAARGGGITLQLLPIKSHIPPTLLLRADEGDRTIRSADFGFLLPVRRSAASHAGARRRISPQRWAGELSQPRTQRPAGRSPRSVIRLRGEVDPP